MQDAALQIPEFLSPQAIGATPDLVPVLVPAQVTLRDESGQPLPPPSSTSGTESSANLIATGLLLVGVILLMANLVKKRRATSRDPSADDTPAEKIAAIRAESQARQTLDSVMVDCEELTQRLATHMDNKAARIEALLAEADQTIARLEHASRQQPHAAASRAPEPELPRTDPLHARIHELADAGRTPVQIAQELQQPTGQVELVLALRNA